MSVWVSAMVILQEVAISKMYLIEYSYHFALYVQMTCLVRMWSVSECFLLFSFLRSLKTRQICDTSYYVPVIGDLLCEQVS